MSKKPYKLNVEGDFFVEDGECLACTLPITEAPDLIGEDEYHCYFKKQPKTDEEIRDAIFAMEVSCCEAVRYKGKDTDVIAKIKAKNLESQIDIE